MGSRALDPAKRAAGTAPAAPRRVLQRKCACGCHTTGEAECEECRKKGSVLQRRDIRSDKPDRVPPVVDEVLHSAGAPLDQATRDLMEAHFDRDFSQVRVHTDDRAAASAAAVNARAYTVGSHVVMGPGEVTAGSPDAELLAHELTHTLQQAGGVGGSGPLSMTAAGDAAESEADTAARTIATQGRPAVATRTSVQLARQQFHPAPAPGVFRPSPPPPQTIVKVPRRLDVPRPETPKPKKSAKRKPPGFTSRFPDDTPTKALAKWDYVVYDDHVRLGNRVVAKDKQTGASQVIGAWPWMTNNPGDLTVDVKPPKKRKQETRAFGLGAFPGVAARTDLAIFPTMETGEEALRTWIRTYYAKLTIADAARKHLGPATAHVPGVDDPVAYGARVQKCLKARGVDLNVSSTKVADLTEDQLDEVATCFGVVEGVENAGIIYTCAGRDSAHDRKLEKWKTSHAFVKALPQSAPPEILELLGCG